MSEFDIDIALTEINKDNLAQLVEIALAMYLGEQCKYCGRTYETLDDLRDTVFAGYHDHGRLACSACWELNHSV